jgi:hypothetical protein
MIPFLAGAFTVIMLELALVGVWMVDHVRRELRLARRRELLQALLAQHQVLPITPAARAHVFPGHDTLQ